jgi:hypothetical protein
VVLGSYPECRIFDVDSVLSFFPFVDVSIAADVSVVHAASVFRVDMMRVSECSYCGIFAKSKNGGARKTVLAR